MDNDMYSLRVLSKGEVSDLGKGFNLGGKPFSVYVRSKSATEIVSDTLLNCKLICDNSFGNIPVPVGDWTPAAIVEIAPNAIDLQKYEIYWGAGEIIRNN